MRLLLAMLVTTVWLTGCVDYTTPLPQPPQTVSEANREAVWNAALEVMRYYDYDVDIQDRRAGVISSVPTVGRQWFEFWRHDGVTAEDVLENSLQTIYRTMKITISPTAPNASTYRAQVEVSVYRSDRAQPQLTSTADAIALFLIAGVPRSQMQTLRVSHAADRTQQVSLGRDEKMENQVAREIAQRSQGQRAGWATSGPSGQPDTQIAPAPQE